MSATNPISGVLQKHRVEIQKNWVGLLNAAVASSKGRVSPKDLAQQAEEFLTVLEAALRSQSLDIRATEWEGVRGVLEDLSRRRVLAGFAMKEECKWAKPCYTADGKNIVLIQGFKESLALMFFQGALLNDSKKVLVQLGKAHAPRVMKFTSVKEIEAKAATIKSYVREAIAAEKAGLRMKPKKTSDYPVPRELSARLHEDAQFKRAFEALTPGRQRGYLHYFASAKQSATRAARIEKAIPAIFDGIGFLERR